MAVAAGDPGPGDEGRVPDEGPGSGCGVRGGQQGDSGPGGQSRGQGDAQERTGPVVEEAVTLEAVRAWQSALRRAHRRAAAAERQRDFTATIAAAAVLK